MIIVKIKIKFLVILILFVVASCKTVTNENDNHHISRKSEIVKKHEYKKIETNSFNAGFDFNLINTLLVKERDTILFRIWEVKDVNTITLKKSKFKIQNSKYINYYKTGKNKFSKYKIIVKNELDKDVFHFYYYVNLKTDEDPYDMYRRTSYAKIIKINDSIGRFDLSRIHTDAFFMNFQIKNKEIYIKKIIENPSFFSENHYELDTLIIINKMNNIIDVGKLYDITHNKRNLKKYKEALKD